MHCSVKNCPNSQKMKDKHLISFHRFPKMHDMKSRWIRSLGLTNDVVNIRSVVCSNHFFENDYIGFSKSNKNLFPSSVPHLDAQEEEIFPSTSDLKKLWVSSLKLDTSSLSPNSVVCSNHFKPNDFFGDPMAPHRRLFPAAVPHLDDVVDEVPLPSNLDLQNKCISSLNLDPNRLHDKSVDSSNGRRLYPSSLPLPVDAADATINKLSETVLDEVEYFGAENVVAEESIETDPLCIDEFVEKELEKIEESELRAKEQNLQIIQNIQLAPPRTQMTKPQTNYNDKSRNIQFASPSTPTIEPQTNLNNNSQNIQLAPPSTQMNEPGCLFFIYKLPVGNKIVLEPSKQITSSVLSKEAPEDELSHMHKAGAEAEKRRKIETQSVLNISTLQCHETLSPTSPSLITAQDKPIKPNIKPHTNDFNLDDYLLFPQPLAAANKVCHKEVLKSSNILTKSTPREETVEDKLRKLQEKVAAKNKKIKVLSQTVRRRAKRIDNLKKTVSTIKNSKVINAETAEILQKCIDESDLIDVLWT